MRKLALDDDILLEIEKPARYIGGEVNAVMKNVEDIDVRFAMCFPDVYEIGMSHLGIQILYDMFNRREDVWCERVYSPWHDLDKVMREQQIPLFALESQDPIKDFDFLGITIQFEMCYTNILQILDLSQIPLHAKDRTLDDPFVIGGGPCTYNPEPIAEFFDIFYIGEGETVYFELLDCYKENKKNGGNRRDFLEKAAQIEGIYVPAFYDVEYNEDGTLKNDIKKIADTYNAYVSGTLENVKGFCAVATTEEIAKQDYILTPGRYVGIEEQQDDGEPFEEKMARLTSELSDLFVQSHKLEAEIKEKLGAIGYEI